MLNTIKQLKYLTSFQYLMIITDFALTNFALNNGFYETNKFTNHFGLLAHNLMLIGITYIIFKFAKREVNNHELHPFATFLLTIMSSVWMLNNIVSVYLLSSFF